MIPSDGEEVLYLKQLDLVAANIKYHCILQFTNYNCKFIYDIYKYIYNIK